MLKLKALFYFLQTWIVLLSFNFAYGLGKYDKKDLENLREEVRQMFQHAYESYLNYAYPYDELRPLSCDGVDTWGSYSLTLIDALDTLAVMGNYSEFQRVVNIVTANANFDANINVSVFETNIRIIGGLLSAHLLSQKAGVNVVPGWPCNGPLLELAEDVARRLIAAFDTPTGMPYGTVNLQHGVPLGETTITCTAGVGTFILELGTLSRLTGDPIFEEVALTALDALHAHRSPLGLVGNHVDVASGRWTAQDAGIGAGVDSYYEYLAKGAILLQRPELMHMFLEGKGAIEKYLKRDDWHLWVSMSKGQVTLPVFQSLEAYWPGVLSLTGDIHKGMKSLHNYHQVWKQYGFTPEFYYIPQGEAGTNRESYPLRPELIESVMYLYRATGDPYLIEVGKDILRSIQHSAKTPCGYATIKDVRDHRKEDRMESFFLAETTKYLYLLFDPDNFLHNQGQSGTVVRTPWGECVVDAGGYIFNTEAHPIDPGALHCCSGARQMDVQESLSGAVSANDVKGIPLSMHRKSEYIPTIKEAWETKQEQSQDIHTQSETAPNLYGQLDLISKAQIAKLADSMLPAQDVLLSTNGASQNSELKQADVDVSPLRNCQQDLSVELGGVMDVIHLTDPKNDASQWKEKNDVDITKEQECVGEPDSKSSTKALNGPQEVSAKLNSRVMDELREFCKKFSITKCLEMNDLNQDDPHIEAILNDIYLQALPKRLQTKLDKLKVAASNMIANDVNKIEPHYGYKETLKNTNLDKLFNDKNLHRQISGTNLQKVMMLVEKAIDESQVIDKTDNDNDKGKGDVDDKDVPRKKLDKSEGLGTSDTLSYQADDSDQIFSGEGTSQQQTSDGMKGITNVADTNGDAGEDNSNCHEPTETTHFSEEGCEHVEPRGQGSSEHQLQHTARPLTVRAKFDPQSLFERLQSENRYKRNGTWITDYTILSCCSQPFLQRLSMSGEMFEVP